MEFAQLAPLQVVAIMTAVETVERRACEHERAHDGDGRLVLSEELVVAERMLENLVDFGKHYSLFDDAVDVREVGVVEDVA